MSGRNDPNFLNLMGFGNVFPNPNARSSSNPNPLNLTPEQQQQLKFMWQQNFQTQSEQQTQTPLQTQTLQAASVDPEAMSQQKRKREGKRMSKNAKKPEVYDEKNPDVSGTTLRWTPEEEVLLAKCYVVVPDDKNVGVSQKGTTFRYRVMNEFNMLNFQVRNKDMITSKWHTINANCQKFLAVFKRVKRLEKSGENELNIIGHDRQMYRDVHKGVSFA